MAKSWSGVLERSRENFGSGHGKEGGVMGSRGGCSKVEALGEHRVFILRLYRIQSPFEIERTRVRSGCSKNDVDLF